MYLIIWEFQVKADRESEFASAFSEQGDWAQLFRNSLGYIGTELLHDQIHKGRYLTIDRWTSKDAYDTFRLAWDAEYKALDQKCSHWTEQESALGCFVNIRATTDA